MRNVVQLLYGVNAQGELMHVDEVENGLRCRCFCPCCGAPLVAKNNGANTKSHFAHESGSVCSNAHETELHLLAKDVLKKEEALYLPSYGEVFKGKLQKFNRIEIEERNDTHDLQPDVVGVQLNPVDGTEHRVWIEIFVTHCIDRVKYNRIKSLGIACVEIDLSFLRNRMVTRRELADLFLNSEYSRRWINNPVLEMRQERLAYSRKRYGEIMADLRMRELIPADVVEDINAYYELNHLNETKVNHFYCLSCPFHTTRKLILDEISKQSFPVRYRDFFRKTKLSWWTENNLDYPLEKEDYNSVTGEGFQFVFWLKSPDRNGNIVPEKKIEQNHRLIRFFAETLPSILRINGFKCMYNVHYHESNNYNYDISCSNPMITSRTRGRLARSR